MIAIPEEQVIAYCADLARHMDEAGILDPDARRVFVEKVSIPFLVAIVGKPQWTRAMDRALASAITSPRSLQ